MKIVLENINNSFADYDTQVQQGVLFNYDSGKNKPAVRTDANGRSYKVYESEINLCGRLSRFAAIALPSLIGMPLWSKECNRLWNEAASGREKVKVFAAPQPETAAAVNRNTEISPIPSIEVISTGANKGKRPGSVKLMQSYVDRIFGLNGEETPSTVVIYMHLKIDSKTIDKQFLFKAENGEALDRSEIKQKLHNYYKNEFVKELNVKKATRVEYDVLVVSKNLTGFNECVHKIVNSAEQLRNQQGVSHGLARAPGWLIENMPNVKNAYRNGEFIKLEGIYQPL